MTLQKYAIVPFEIYEKEHGGCKSGLSQDTKVEPEPEVADPEVNTEVPKPAQSQPTSPSAPQGPLLPPEFAPRPKLAKAKKQKRKLVWIER
jgi:hypothetical protein